MSYKTGRGNVAKKCLRFHAPVKMIFDYQSVTKCPVAASRRTFNFMLPTGSCVDMPRHGSARSWVIRMPGFIGSQESKRLSSSGRGEPFPPAPRRSGGRYPRVSPSSSFLIASFPLCQTFFSATWSFRIVPSRCPFSVAFPRYVSPCA